MSTPPPVQSKTPPARPPGRPALPPKAPANAAPRVPARVPKTFKIVPWGGEGEGEKISVVAQSGMGKTTLASMAPKPVFIGLDDGVRRCRDPRDGSILHAIPDIRDYQDTRDALNQHSLFDGFKTVVLDTATKLEELSEPYIFENYKTAEGKTVKSIEGYGWGKGYRHALEVFRLFLQDCEGLIRKGFNVILLCQESSATMPNAEGLDYMQAGPKLHHTKQFSTRLELQEWSDHVFRIDHLETKVSAVGTNATKGKVVSTDTTRGIYTTGARHFFAKSRPVNGVTLPPIISFEDASDDSLWQLMFPTAE